ncbi:gluconokinase [Sphingomonas sp. HF-S3]|uniref:Gluconokinase n=1 Tax=Sphingomonas rustica TaxID=3103142 RepID=A0ABV0B557_9SPHN
MPGDDVQAQLKRSGSPPYGIVVMGVSGCGKSTLVEHLAARLAVPAFEGDAFHSSASVAKMRSGQPLDDDDRWPWLDRLGASIGGAVRDHGSAVAACSALKRSYRERLERAAGVPLMFVLLDGAHGEIAPRLAARANHYMAPALLDSQFATLERPGADENALVVHCYRPVEALGSEVIAWARRRLAR